MFKVSIVHLNKTQITLESDEPEVLREIVSMALRDLPRDFAIQAASAAAGQPGSAPAAAKPEPDRSPVKAFPAVEYAAS